jgi:hypothetical protein
MFHFGHFLDKLTMARQQKTGDAKHYRFSKTVLEHLDCQFGKARHVTSCAVRD